MKECYIRRRLIIVHLRGKAREGFLAAPITARSAVGHGAQFSQAAPSIPLRPASTAYPWYCQVESENWGYVWSGETFTLSPIL
jgi:hypothetical protein